MAEGVFNRAALRIANGSIDLLTDTLKVMLVDSGYTFNRDSDFVGSGAGTPGGEELTGSGYVAGFGGAGRKTLAGKVITEDDTADRAVLDATDPVWTAINAGTAAAMILIKEGTSDADSELIAFYDTGFPKVTNGGDLTYVIAAPASGGLLQFSTV